MEPIPCTLHFIDQTSSLHGESTSHKIFMFLSGLVVYQHCLVETSWLSTVNGVKTGNKQFSADKPVRSMMEYLAGSFWGKCCSKFHTWSSSKYTNQISSLVKSYIGRYTN